MKKLAFLAVLTVSVFNGSAQNIGIGVTNPTRAKLEVNGVAGDGATSAIFGGESTGISIQRNWPGIGFNQYYYGGSKFIANGFAAVQYLDPNYGGIYFDVFPNGNANEFCGPQRRVLSLYQSGTVGLHGTIHQSLFNSGVSEDTYIRAGKDNGRVFINDIPGGRTIIRGAAGVNTFFPKGSLHVQGRFAVSNEYDFDTWTFNVGVNGIAELQLNYEVFLRGVFNKNSGSYSSLSDIRFKKNIKSVAPLLHKVMQLEPVEYDMINTDPEQTKTIGFIAQDVNKIFPELVTIVKGQKESDPAIADLHTLNYSGFGVLAIKAVQEQQQIIQSLQSKIESLESKLNELMKSVSVEGSRLR